MHIFYEYDEITDNCKNKCPFINVGHKGETGTDCQVGSITCQECKFCYGHKYSGVDVLFVNDKRHIRTMRYIKCMWGEDNKWKKFICKIKQFFFRIKYNMTNDWI